MLNFWYLFVPLFQEKHEQRWAEGNNTGRESLLFNDFEQLYFDDCYADSYSYVLIRRWKKFTAFAARARDRQNWLRNSAHFTTVSGTNHLSFIYV